MKTRINIRQFVRTKIRIHVTWLFLVPLITFIIITQYPETYPLWQRATYGLITSLLVFIMICLRELVISYAASRRGLPLLRINLFIFGGVYPIIGEIKLPTVGLLLAVIGLLSNLVLAGVFYLAHSILIVANNLTVDIFIQWLVFIAFMFSLLHFIPAGSLDGGRILRVFLSKITKSFFTAARITALIGQVVGLLFFVGGILLIITSGQWLTGLFLILIGWALQIAAIQNRKQIKLIESIQYLNTEDVISKRYTLVHQEIKLDKVVAEYIISKGIQYFFTLKGNNLHGLFTIEDVRKVSKRKWKLTGAGEIAKPLIRTGFVSSQQPATIAIERMDRLERECIPVIDGGELVGIIIRSELIALAETQARLGVKYRSLRHLI